jgi:hypothetical protein
MYMSQLERQLRQHTCVLFNSEIFHELFGETCKGSAASTALLEKAMSLARLLLPQRRRPAHDGGLVPQHSDWEELVETAITCIVMHSTGTKDDSCDSSTIRLSIDFLEDATDSFSFCNAQKQSLLDSGAPPVKHDQQGPYALSWSISGVSGVGGSISL